MSLESVLFEKGVIFPSGATCFFTQDFGMSSSSIDQLCRVDTPKKSHAFDPFGEGKIWKHGEFNSQTSLQAGIPYFQHSWTVSKTQLVHVFVFLLSDLYLLHWLGVIPAISTPVSPIHHFFQLGGCM